MVKPNYDVKIVDKNIYLIYRGREYVMNNAGEIHCDNIYDIEHNIFLYFANIIAEMPIDILPDFCRKIIGCDSIIIDEIIINYNDQIKKIINNKLEDVHIPKKIIEIILFIFNPQNIYSDTELNKMQCSTKEKLKNVKKYFETVTIFFLYLNNVEFGIALNELQIHGNSICVFNKIINIIDEIFKYFKISRPITNDILMDCDIKKHEKAILQILNKFYADKTYYDLFALLCD